MTCWNKGVVRPSKSPSVNHALLVPRSAGVYRLVMDYRKVNSKVVFYSYPMLTIEQAFGCRVVFCLRLKFRTLSNPPFDSVFFKLLELASVVRYLVG